MNKRQKVGDLTLGWEESSVSYIQVRLFWVKTVGLKDLGLPPCIWWCWFGEASGENWCFRTKSSQYPDLFCALFQGRIFEFHPSSLVLSLTVVGRRFWGSTLETKWLWSRFLAPAFFLCLTANHKSPSVELSPSPPASLNSILHSQLNGSKMAGCRKAVVSTCYSLLTTPGLAVCRKQASGSVPPLLKYVNTKK